MINTLIILITAIFATIHVLYRRKKLDHTQMIDLYMLYFLVAGVGIIGGLGFVSHVFFANATARMIGWPTGSPFQFEVGMHDGAWAMLGFLCLYFRGNFWLATALGWSFFMLGACFGHIKETLFYSNYSPYNVGTILPDLLVPLILLSLLMLHYYATSAPTRKRKR